MSVSLRPAFLVWRLLGKMRKAPLFLCMCPAKSRLWDYLTLPLGRALAAVPRVVLARTATHWNALALGDHLGNASGHASASTSGQQVWARFQYCDKFAERQRAPVDTREEDRAEPRNQKDPRPPLGVCSLGERLRRETMGGLGLAPILPHWGGWCVPAWHGTTESARKCTSRLLRDKLRAPCLSARDIRRKKTRGGVASFAKTEVPASA